MQQKLTEWMPLAFYRRKKNFSTFQIILCFQQTACAFHNNNNNNNAISVSSVHPGRREHYTGKMFYINKSMEIDDFIFLRPEIRILIIITQMDFFFKNSLGALEMNQNNFMWYEKIWVNGTVGNDL